ncbi:MAG TPA: hypothetical protein DCS97_14875 [Planctomycetes bacterium]|nr:hypothetical protein [Planctomycetota bacterium]
MRPFLLCTAVLLLSACVWSRLLDWKGQLKEFDRYFTPVEEGQALVLQMKEPCIRAADIGYLLGGEKPSSTTPRTGGGFYVSWLLRRDRADSIGLDIALGVPDLGEDTLADSLRIPPAVTAFLPKDRLVAMARAFGSAEIDKDKRQAAGGFSAEDAKPITPGRAVVVAALGEPDQSEQRDDHQFLTYRFKLVLPDGTLGKASNLQLEMRGEQLLSARLTAPNFNAWMRLDGAK